MSKEEKNLRHDFGKLENCAKKPKELITIKNKTVLIFNENSLTKQHN